MTTYDERHAAYVAHAEAVERIHRRILYGGTIALVVFWIVVLTIVAVLIFR